MRNVPDLSELDIQEDPNTIPDLTDILNKYTNIFSDRIGITKLIENDVLLKNPTPIALKLYPNPKEKPLIINTMVSDMEEQSLVEQSTTSSVVPVILEKTKDGAHCLCVDYRCLNDVTKFDTYPMPDLNKLIQQMKNAKIFSDLYIKTEY